MTIQHYHPNNIMVWLFNTIILSTLWYEEPFTTIFPSTLLEIHSFSGSINLKTCYLMMSLNFLLASETSLSLTYQWCKPAGCAPSPLISEVLFNWRNHFQCWWCWHLNVCVAQCGQISSICQLFLNANQNLVKCLDFHWCFPIWLHG